MCQRQPVSPGAASITGDAAGAGTITLLERAAASEVCILKGAEMHHPHTLQAALLPLIAASRDALAEAEPELDEAHLQVGFRCCTPHLAAQWQPCTAPA